MLMEISSLIVLQLDNAFESLGVLVVLRIKELRFIFLAVKVLGLAGCPVEHIQQCERLRSSVGVSSNKDRRVHENLATITLRQKKRKGKETEGASKLNPAAFTLLVWFIWVGSNRTRLQIKITTHC